MQTLVIIPVGRETVDKIMIVSLLDWSTKGTACFGPKGSHHKKNYENLDEIKYRFTIFEKIRFLPNFSRKSVKSAKRGVFWPN